MAIFFGIIMAIGLLYLLSTIIGGLGESLDFGLDGMLEGTGVDVVLGIDMPDDIDTDVQGIGCLTLSAIFTTFGAVGLAGILTDTNMFVIVIVALVFSYLIGRGVAWLMRMFYSQQGTAVYKNTDLIGKTARITINTAAGKTGEGIVEGGQIIKYSVQEVNGLALNRGDIVNVVGVNGRFLQVEKSEEISDIN